jgi:hypothetical protein
LGSSLYNDFIFIKEKDDPFSCEFRKPPRQLSLTSQCDPSLISFVICPFPRCLFDVPSEPDGTNTGQSGDFAFVVKNDGQFFAL